MSTIYYAAFHYLSHTCADLLVGMPADNPSKHAWQQVYRSLEHKNLLVRCKDIAKFKFPPAIEDLAHHINLLQYYRHLYDYAYDEAPQLSTVKNYLKDTRDLMAGFEVCPLRDRKAFAVYIVIKAQYHLVQPPPSRPQLRT